MKEASWLLAFVLMGTSMVFAARPIDTALLVHLLDVALLFSLLVAYEVEPAAAAVAAAVLGVHPLVVTPVTSGAVDLSVASGVLVATFGLLLLRARPLRAPLFVVAACVIIVPMLLGARPGFSLILPREVTSGAYLPVLGLALFIGAVTRAQLARGGVLLAAVLAFVSAQRVWL